MKTIDILTAIVLFLLLVLTIVIMITPSIDARPIKHGIETEACYPYVAPDSNTTVKPNVTTWDDKGYFTI